MPIIDERVFKSIDPRDLAAKIKTFTNSAKYEALTPLLINMLKKASEDKNTMAKSSDRDPTQQFIMTLIAKLLL
jgi:hypothetical protein